MPAYWFLELPDPPSSTPEPTENTETTEQILEPSAAAELQVKLQGHVSKSSKQSKRPKLQRQSNVTDDEEEIQSSTCGKNCGETNSNVDSSYLEENCTPTNRSSNQWTSDVQDDQLQWSRPSWVVEKAFQRSNPTLRLWVTVQCCKWTWLTIKYPCAPTLSLLVYKECFKSYSSTFLIQIK